MTATPKYVMRDSGHEWLGEIPAHWQSIPFRHVFRESSEVNGLKPVGEMLSISGYRGVEFKEYSSDSMKRDDDQLETYRVVRVGQLAVNTMWLNYAGLGVSKVEGHMSPAYRSYDFKLDVNRDYIHHLLRSQSYVQGYTARLQGVRPNSLQMSRESLMTMPVLIPPRAEQDAIVEFLDRELKQIDSLVENQETLIELLANRKASSIAEAVTGTSLDCLFTESPLPWLKRFPSVWKRGRVKQVGQVKLGKMIQQESKSVEDVLVPYLSSTSVQETGISIDQEKKMWASPQELVDLRIKKDDVLVLEGGAAGRSFRAGEDIEGVVFQNSLNRVRLDKGKVTPKFFDYWMSYLVSRGVVEAVCNKATIMHLTAEKLKDLPVLIPSLEEQVEITNHLDKLIEHSDRLTDRAQTVLNVLAERRATLIFAAVTGKLELKVATDG